MDHAQMIARRVEKDRRALAQRHAADRRALAAECARAIMAQRIDRRDQIA